MAAPTDDFYVTVKDFLTYMELNSNEYCYSQFKKEFDYWYRKNFANVRSLPFIEMKADVSNMTINPDFTLSVNAWHSVLKTRKNIANTDPEVELYAHLIRRTIDHVPFKVVMKDVQSQRIDHLQYYSYLAFKKCYLTQYLNHVVKGKEVKDIHLVLTNKVYI